MISNYGGLGGFEYIVLLSVLNLEQFAYSTAIRTDIEVVTGHRPSVGAVHATLVRLERKGLLSSCVEPPTGEPGGRAKRIYAIEPAGFEAMRRIREVLRRFHAALCNPHRNRSELPAGALRRLRPVAEEFAGCRYPACLRDFY